MQLLHNRACLKAVTLCYNFIARAVELDIAPAFFISVHAMYILHYSIISVGSVGVLYRIVRYDLYILMFSNLHSNSIH